MTKGIKWYRLDDVLKHDAQYYIIYGERSNGKSYAVDEYMLKDFFLNGNEFIIMKRYEEDMKGKYMERIFPGELLEWIERDYNKKIKFYRGVWYCYEADEEFKVNKGTIMGYALSLANVNRTKATNYPNVATILFEEFMSVDCKYLKDEVNLLVNNISTVVRHRHNVKIFMLANAISKYSPYSDALSIRLHRVEKGKIITREYKDSKGFKTKFVIQRSENVNVFDNSENKDKVVYNIFGNSGVGQMITTGDFEVHAYKRRVNNVTFSELKREKTELVFNKQDAIKLVICFEDYFYRIYLKFIGSKVIAGYREIDINSIKKTNTDFILNGKGFNDIDCIVNLARINIPSYNKIFDFLIQTLHEQEFVTLTDDDGENIINAYRQMSISV